MHFASIRIVTEDIEALVTFYSRLLGTSPARPAPVFASFTGPSGTLAIQTSATAAAMGPGVVDPGANRSVIIEFRVEDVDAEFERVRDWAPEVAMEPRTMPWGNRSLLLRDPDGNLVNLFAPAAQSE